MLSWPRRHVDTLAEHRAILEALKARDGAAAAVAMDNHLNAVLMELTTFMAVNPAVFEGPE
jgi:DNA-binding GntR family transcriptional regulator